MRTKAPVLIAPREPMQMLDVDVSEPAFGEVRVKMTASGVCHSCLHAADGTHTGAPMPIILGDEGSGVVESVGEGCTRLKVGDHVIISWAPSCNSCRYCATGYPYLCDNTPEFGSFHDGDTRFHHNGEKVYHYGPATYGPYIVVPEGAAVGVRKDFPLDLAALIGCSVTTGFGAVVNAAQSRPGDAVVVFGCGGVGLNAVQGAAIVGANPIIAVDVVDSKLEIAKDFGATHTINPMETDVVQGVMDVTDGGADACIVAVGATKAMEQGLETLAKLGTLVIVGASNTGETITIDPRLINPERRIIGSRYGTANPMTEFPRMVDLAMAGILRVEELVTKRYELEEANEAFRALAAGEQARGLIVF